MTSFTAPPELLALELEVNAMKYLVTVLSDEQEALSAGDAVALAKIVPEKEDALTECRSQSKARVDSMTFHAVPMSPSGVEDWTTRFAGASSQALSAARLAWGKLQTLTEQAKELNRVNGMLILKHSTLIDEVLTKIRGGSSAGATYGPNGKTRPGAQSRSLVVG